MEDDVLAANLAFYRAFATGDVAAMEALWARGHTCACIHPGWTTIHGREAVIASWRAILEEGGTSIAPSDAQAQLIGEVAIVLCRELLEGVSLVATNVFVREEDGWKIVLHQASPIAHGERDDGPASDERVLN